MSGDLGTQLPSLALKLSPARNLLLQAWSVNTSAGTQSAPREVFFWSKHQAEPNTWYHLAIVNVDDQLHLYVNGKLEGSIEFDGFLAQPPRPSDGDVSVARIVTICFALTYVVHARTHSSPLVAACTTAVSPIRRRTNRHLVITVFS
jgi:hypothetical protein